MNEIPKQLDESANDTFGETCGLPDEDDNARSLLKSGFAHYDKGEIYLALDDFIKVIQLINKPIQANRQLESARSMRSSIYEALGDLQKSLEDLDWLIENGYDAYAHRGRLKRAMDDNLGAIEDFTQALKLHPENSEILSQRAFLYYTLNQYEDAINDLTTIIRSRPANQVSLEVYHLRGKSYFKANLPQQALDDFNEVLRLSGYPPVASAEAYPDFLGPR
jgi:tetratricopeptide (TPR) repeat protein